MTGLTQLLHTARLMVGNLVRFVERQIAERRAAKPRRYLNG
ncbi:hypothetical protein [Neorhizobium sp. JUb45]|nr:hypothetical protein [Neorhizobium sp. JUb45]TCR06779.1 hypothetical protein EDF70_101740 [Neorhizobium sp. JUb45]